METSNICLILNTLRKEVQVRPDWLKKNEMGNKIWKSFKHLNTALLLLVQEDYISKKSIQTIIDLFEVNKNGICEDDNLEMLFTLYYIEVLDYINDYCLKYELYEACHNLKIFRQLFNKL